MLLHDVGLFLSVLACSLGALIICLLVLRYGFTRDSELPIGSGGPRPSQLGHAIAAALFGTGVVFAVVAVVTLTALPLGGMEGYRDLTNRLLHGVDGLRARLSAMESAVERLGERAERSLHAVTRLGQSRAPSGPAPRLASLVDVSRPWSPAAPAASVQSPPISGTSPREVVSVERRADPEATPVQPSPREEAEPAKGRRRGSPSPNAASAERAERVDGRPSQSVNGKTKHGAAKTHQEADRDTRRDHPGSAEERGRRSNRLCRVP
jgi:hypothetical protein